MALFLEEEHTSVMSVLRSQHALCLPTTTRQNYSSPAAKYAVNFAPES
jgi:hypothetical protein